MRILWRYGRDKYVIPVCPRQNQNFLNIFLFFKIDQPGYHCQMKLAIYKPEVNPENMKYERQCANGCNDPDDAFRYIILILEQHAKEILNEYRKRCRAMLHRRGGD